MNIIELYNEVRKQLLPLVNIPIYKEFKTTEETGTCLVLNSVPLKKNNYESILDLVVVLYLKKVSSSFDGKSALNLFPIVEGGIKDLYSSNSFVNITQSREGETVNLDDSYSTTEFVFRTIIRNNK